MKNILNEKPSKELKGRPLKCANFVDNADLKNKNVLDIGCGFGWFELNALDRGVNGITGTELSENDLKAAKENITNDKVNFKIGSAINLPFGNETFDTAVSWEVIEHLPKNTEDKMFAEISRVLKPGGCFYLSTPRSSFFCNILDPAWWLIGHRHYTEKELTNYAKNNNFETVKTETGGGWWSIMYILNMYIAKWIFKRGLFYNDLFSEKDTAEYSKKNGFINIFSKFKKIK